MMYMHSILISLWRPVLEILILWFLFYRLSLFFEGTRAAYVFRGIGILIFAYFVFQITGLRTLEWIFTKIFAISVLALLIIFQPELRQGLARLGQRHLFSPYLREEDLRVIFKEIIDAAAYFSKNKIGALIALERDTKLEAYRESGVEIDSKINSELIQTIFSPTTLLHDGGIVIRGDRIIAAGCLFPLTENPYLSRTFGTRHRAAIGLSEQSDALAIVVSEETGDISLAKEGALNRNLTPEELNKLLIETFRMAAAKK